MSAGNELTSAPSPTGSRTFLPISEHRPHRVASADRQVPRRARRRNRRGTTRRPRPSPRPAPPASPRRRPERRLHGRFLSVSLLRSAERRLSSPIAGRTGARFRSRRTAELRSLNPDPAETPERPSSGSSVTTAAEDHLRDAPGAASRSPFASTDLSETARPSRARGEPVAWPWARKRETEAGSFSLYGRLSARGTFHGAQALSCDAPFPGGTHTAVYLARPRTPPLRWPCRSRSTPAATRRHADWLRSYCRTGLRRGARVFSRSRTATSTTPCATLLIQNSRVGWPLQPRQLVRAVRVPEAGERGR